MLTPYLVLDVTPEASDKDIRQRYLALVRQYPPEQAPDRFQQVTTAYEAVKDARSRVQTAILGAATYADVDLAVDALVQARPPRRRCAGLRDLLVGVGRG